VLWAYMATIERLPGQTCIIDLHQLAPVHGQMQDDMSAALRTGMQAVIAHMCCTYVRAVVHAGAGA
jgi:hypothetical protein